MTLKTLQPQHLYGVAYYEWAIYKIKHGFHPAPTCLRKQLASDTGIFRFSVIGSFLTNIKRLMH